MNKRGIREVRKAFEELGPNMITDQPVAYDRAGSFGIEVSEGVIFDKKLFGVSVMDMKTKKIDHDQSKPFNTIEEAWKYISSLKDQHE